MLFSLPFIKINMSKVSQVPALLFKLYLTEANELLAIKPDILLEDLIFDIYYFDNLIKPPHCGKNWQ